MPSIHLSRVAKIQGKKYDTGIHEISDEVAGDEYLQALVKDGHAVVIGQKPIEAKEVDDTPADDTRTMADLKKEADDLGIEYDKKTKKADLIAAIAEAQADEIA